MNNKFTSRNFFLTCYKKNKFSFIILFISMVAISLSSLLPSLILKRIIDDFLMPSIADNNLDVKNIIIWTIFYFLSYFLIYGFTILENIFVDNLGQKMIHMLRYEMVKKTDKLKSDYFRHTGTGVMVSRIMDDVYSIENLFTDGIISLIVSLLKIISILISIFIFSWLLGLIVFVCIPIVFFLTKFFRDSLFKIQINQRKISNKETNNLSESIDNIVTLNNLSKKAYREKEFEDELIQEKTEKKKAAFYDSTFSPIVMFLRSIVIASVTIIVAYSIKDQSHIAGLTAGTFAASITLISNIFSPIQELGQEIQTMQEGISGIKRVQDFMNLEEDNEKDLNLTAGKILAEMKENIIEFHDLSFHYSDGNELIYDKANGVIHLYDKTSIIGRTGAGKTTLFYLLLSLLTPTNGKITINGYDTIEIPNSEKRKIFGYVQQGFEAIDGTIEEQITLKDATISLDKVREAMKVVILDDVVMNKIEGKYKAKFKKENFSRGQLQLLSLARALVYDPPILLLDEISANLDSETEKNLIEALNKVGKKKTMISISHRLSDQLGFNKIIKVEQGKMVQD